MVKFKENNKFFIKIFLYSFIFKNIILCEEECLKKTPIKFGTECLAIYCSKSQFISGDCIISNSIIKTQWLNDIILLGEKDFRYINFITSSNGEMILYTSAYPHSYNRIYYGINSNGNPLFKDSNGNSIFIIKKAAQTSSRFESITGNLIVTGDNDVNEEYLLSVGKGTSKTEILDYNNYDYKLTEINYSNTINISPEIYIGVFLSFIENNKNYYIFGTIYKKGSNYKLILIKFYFGYDANGDFKYNKITESDDFDTLDRKLVYCYLNNLNSNNIIICMYVSKNANFTLLFLNSDLEFIKKIETSIISSELPSINIFFKFIHLKDNLDILAYYKGIKNDYPTLQLIETKISTYSYLAELKEEILLNQYIYNSSATLCDFIKIRDDLVCLSGTSPNKEILIISLINFYEEMEYNIRYYEVDFFNLYKHKFFRDMKLYLYNKYVVLGFSCCFQSSCNLTTEDHYSSLIFFSYPNSTERNLDIINHLKKEENNEIILDLFDKVTIDNNIFGFILYGIKINSIDNCGINFITNKTNNAINKNDIISKNEIIKIDFLEDEYQISNCKLIYSIIITEPEYEEYNKYANHIYKENNEDEKELFSNTLYEGKVETFEILISQEIIFYKIKFIFINMLIL